MPLSYFSPMGMGRTWSLLFVSLTAPWACGGGSFSAAEDAGQEDATSAGSQAEASVVPEGGAPTDAASDAPDGGHWCASQTATFCADFDEVTDIAAVENSWSGYTLLGGAFSLDTGPNVPSPPNALKVATSATSNVDTLLLQTLPRPQGPVSKVRLDFSLEVDSAANIGLLSAAAYAAIIFGTDATGSVVALTLGNGPKMSALYSEGPDAGWGGTTGTSFQTAFPAENQWAGRFAIEVTFSGSGSARTGCVQAYVAETIAQLSPCLSLPPAMLNPTVVSIALGVYSGGVGNTGNVALRYDDVLATLK